MAIDPGMLAQAGQAREKILKMFPPQSTVGRAMRAFHNAGNPITGVINMIGSIFKGSKYRGGQYVMGEKYMLYVLGIDIHDRKKVPDEIVPEASDFFTALTGVPILTWEAMDELRADIEKYRKNRPEGKDVDVLKLQKAKELLQKLPFNDIAGAWQSPLQSMAESDTSQAGVAASVATALGIAPGSEGLKKWLLPIVGLFVLIIIFRFFKRK